MCGLALFSLPEAYAQSFPCTLAPEDAKPDTLDYTGYVPLQIGNRWEVSESDGRPLSGYYTQEIVSDTLIEGDRYYKMMTQGYRYSRGQLEFQGEGYQYIRHTDSSMVRWSNGRVRDNYQTYGLSSPFQSCTEDRSLSILGRPDTTIVIDPKGVRDTVHVAAVKTVQLSIWGSWSYAHGIGRYQALGDPSVVWTLTYAHIDGKEYGEPISIKFATSTERPVALTHTHYSVYPSPSDGTFTMQAEGRQPVEATVALYDLTGRQLVNAGPLPYRASYRHRISLPEPIRSGMYQLVIRTASTRAVTLPLIVIR
ncbi:MAG: hypothetical protein RhofKO_21570 [Rhodothermales bacterium]